MRDPPATISPFLRASSAASWNVSTASSLMMGPSQFSLTSGSPTLMASAFSFSLATNSSYTSRCTYTREVAEHFCPPKPNADLITPSLALSRSAFAETIAGFFPPISQIAGLGKSLAKCR